MDIALEGCDSSLMVCIMDIAPKGCDTSHSVSIMGIICLLPPNFFYLFLTH